MANSEGTKRLIIKANSSDENMSADYGIFDMDVDRAKQYIELIRQAIVLEKTINRFYSFEVFDYSVEYFNYFDDLAEMKFKNGEYYEDYFNEHDYLIVPPSATFFVPDESVVRSEVNTMVVSPDDIHWEANMKHTSVRLATRRISLIELINIAEGRKVMRAVDA